LEENEHGNITRQKSIVYLYVHNMWTKAEEIFTQLS